MLQLSAREESTNMSEYMAFATNTYCHITDCMNVYLVVPVKAVWNVTTKIELLVKILSLSQV